MAKNWIFDSDFSFADKKFSRIYRFFVIEAPVDEKVSRRAKHLDVFNKASRKITDILKKNIPSLNKNWKTVLVRDRDEMEKIEQDVKNLCKQSKILDEVSDRKEVFIHTDMKKNKTKSLIYSIRCAFAHGAFSKTEFYGEQYYFFENRDKGKLRGRIVVKEDNLIKIIDIFENFDKYLKPIHKGAK